MSETKRPYGRKNIWTCRTCGKRHVAIDVDEGVTPFMMDCSTPRCGGMAYSQFYELTPEEQELPAEYEWYKPTPKRYRKLALYDKSHVDKGGLLLRMKTA